MYAESILIIFCYMVLFFLIAQWVKDNSIIDIGWGLGFVVIVIYTLWRGNTYNVRQVILSSLVLLWGLRLGSYLFLRWLKKGEEDFRYQAWRKTWKFFVLRSFFQIFMFQGFFMLVIAAPIIFVNAKPTTTTINWIDITGISIWIIGFFFQVAGDSQLAKFKDNPVNKGKIIRHGVWKYSRHPNYFGEATMWWGIYIITINIEQGWTAFFAPLTINLLLLFLSGVPMLERKYKNNPEYQDYIEKTNKFIPWFSKA